MRTPHDFLALSYSGRLHSGQGAIEHLPFEVDRVKAHRAFIICGRTVSRKTALIGHIRDLLGERCAGVFDELDKDTSIEAVQRAAAAARLAQADVLIGVGAGSVLQGVRIVAILLAEDEPLEKLITQYPENGPAVSPKLLAPKLPIINVLTAPTTAQNRGGSAAKNIELDHRMEFFDPKTRPLAIFWDAQALLTAPVSMMKSSACAVYWRSVMLLAAVDLPPLVEGDRLQAWRLLQGALPRIADPVDWQARVDLCAATWLLNRDDDVGGLQVPKTWVMRAVYAFSVALFNLHPEVVQGASYSALTAAVMRVLGARDLPANAALAQVMGVWQKGEPMEAVPGRIALELTRVFSELGMPLRLSELGIPRSSLMTILDHSLKNFNSDPTREFLQHKSAMQAALEAAW